MNVYLQTTLHFKLEYCFQFKNDFDEIYNVKQLYQQGHILRKTTVIRQRFRSISQWNLDPTYNCLSYINADLKKTTCNVMFDKIINDWDNLLWMPHLSLNLRLDTHELF